MAERRKLLLADDSVTIQKVVNLTFADEGIDVLAVGDGDAAMAKFVEFAPDLLMVDVNMPGMDGYQICEMIKQDEETAHIPVILLVGSFEAFDEERAYRVGADGYLTKPFQSIRQLVGKVTSLLDSNADNFVAKTDFNNAITGESAQAFQNYDIENSDSEITVQSTSNAESESGADVVDYQTARFDDADDETIQTNQTGSLPADEAQRFSADFSGEDYAPVSADEPFENSFDYKVEEMEEDRMEAQHLTAEEPREAEEEKTPVDSYSYQTAAPTSENVDKFEDAQTVSDEKDEVEKFGDDESAAAFAATATAATTPNFSWDFDDLDMLELPFHGNAESFKKIEPQIEASETQATEPDAQPETSIAANAQPPNISPEMIEQIAARVAEKLSGKLIAQLTRDLAPQMSDLIAQELSQEKFGED